MHQLSGTVKEIFDEQVFDSGFNKREFVVTDEADKYPQDIKFECVKENVELVNKLNKGDRLKVTFDIRGREWQGKYFVTSLPTKRFGTMTAREATSTKPAAEPEPSTTPYSLRRRRNPPRVSFQALPTTRTRMTFTSTDLHPIPEETPVAKLPPSPTTEQQQAESSRCYPNRSRRTSTSSTRHPSPPLKRPAPSATSQTSAKKSSSTFSTRNIRND